VPVHRRLQRQCRDRQLGTFNQDRARTVASFKRLAELDVETVCFGHGEPIIQAAQARIRDTAATLIG